VNVRLVCSSYTGGRGSVVAFRNLDISVGAGRVATLLGPNGAGKSTLLLTLAGLLPARSGVVRIDGVELDTGKPSAANEAGLVLVPDNRCLFGSLTVEENLKVAARKGGLTPSDMLTTFPGLGSRWGVRAGSLSGGEQQMLTMARALIQGPKVLLIDEMSMGLAPNVVARLFETVRSIANDHGCAVILVEQHVRLALGVADDAIVLNHGAIVLADEASKLLQEPERLEAAYLGAAAGS
jgi:branched-chain amino acid transport system ATP-binding protein